MAEITKPSDLNKIWSSGGDKITPTDLKISTGWEVEIPPRQYFNWLDNRQDQAIAHINQHGVPVWDSATEYQANKSYTQGPTDGLVYKCVSTNTNQNPETDATNTYWKVAFAGVGDFITQTDGDARYLKIASNGSDVSNAATFRTNIGVIAATETVAGLLEIATDGEAQAFTATKAIDGAKLNTAFKGSNQSLTANGYQKLPGGLIYQWGIVFALGGDLTATVTFPIAFPTAVVNVTGQTSRPSVEERSSVADIISPTTTGFTIRNEVIVIGTVYQCDLYWHAIGY